MFLTAVAIVDDLGAIAVIAVFYTDHLSFPMLACAGVLVAALVLMSARGVRRLSAYLVVGALLWLCVLKSGVHATLAGVAVALAVPMGKQGEPSLLEQLEDSLHPWVAFAVLPLFAFANAGVSLAGIGVAQLLSPLPLGIAAGLFLGKQTGVLASVWLAIRLGLAHKPGGASWPQIYGVALLCGVGFTMSLFIGGLAFTDPLLGDEVKIGVLMGSLASALGGYAVLRLAK